LDTPLVTPHATAGGRHFGDFRGNGFQVAVDFSGGTREGGRSAL
jgi:hypothetical protein